MLTPLASFDTPAAISGESTFGLNPFASRSTPDSAVPFLSIEGAFPSNGSSVRMIGLESLPGALVP